MRLQIVSKKALIMRMIKSSWDIVALKKLRQKRMRFLFSTMKDFKHLKDMSFIPAFGKTHLKSSICLISTTLRAPCIASNRAALLHLRNLLLK